MALKYGLLENLLTTAANDFTAQPQQVKSHDTDSVIDKMLKRGSLITKTDILAVINAFYETIVDITIDGETVNLDIFRTHLSISGIFEGATDVFDPKRHNIHINVTAGKILKETIDKVKTEKMDIAEIVPHILEIKDTVSQTTNDLLTPNGVIEVIGSRLKIEGDEDKTGLFFINNTDATVHKATVIVENKPARLIVMVPTLTQGTYMLQIKTQATQGGTILKQPRIGTFHKPLHVV